MSDPLPALMPPLDSWYVWASARASSTDRARMSAAATVEPMSLGPDRAHMAYREKTSSSSYSPFSARLVASSIAIAVSSVHSPRSQGGDSTRSRNGPP
jgi:hypothetical protein